MMYELNGLFIWYDRIDHTKNIYGGRIKIQGCQNIELL